MNFTFVRSVVDFQIGDQEIIGSKLSLQCLVDMLLSDLIGDMAEESEDLLRLFAVISENHCFL